MIDQRTGARYGAYLGRLITFYATVGALGAAVAFIVVTVYAFPHVALGFVAGSVTFGAALFALHLFRDDIRDVVVGAVNHFASFLDRSVLRY